MAELSRILIVKLSSLGDLFHALPAVHNLKVELGVELDWVTQSEYADLVRCFSDVDRVIAFPRRDFVRQAPGMLRALRKRSYAMAVDMQGLVKSALVARLSRSARRLGPSFYREGTALLYSALAGPRNRDRHAVDENLDFVRCLGLTVRPVEFPVRFPPMPLTAPSPRVAIVPVSRWPAKNWPVANFAATARRLQAETGATIFLLGSAANRPACEEIAASLGGRVENRAGLTTLVEMGGLLAQMDLVIANDSGPMHMAVAAGAPVLAVFGASDPRRTGPYGPRHRVAVADLPCRPCRERTCRYGTPKCLDAVTPEHVAALALDMLKG